MEIMDNRRKNWLQRVALQALTLAGLCITALPAQQITLEIKDFLTLPMTGAVDGSRDAAYLARVNRMIEEPGGTGRFFIVDMAGPVYIFDKKTNKLSTYLDFNGREGHSGIFHRLRPDVFSQGLVALQFDPDYVHNGKFYTTHAENPADPGSNAPDNTHFPGLNLTGYTTTPAIPAPGKITAAREDVLIEWTDTNILNTTFEGTAREILRLQLNRNSHPLDDIIFNPTAHRGDPDWRVMYVSSGEGASGESPDPTTRLNPQRLDAMIGKIHRIIPDLAEHTASSTVSENGRYRIPNDNPFVNTPGARKEIWAYGLRNPHWLTWDVDPANANNNHLIADVIGLHTWETVIIVHKGANYGYSLREGNQQLNADNSVSPIPEVDRIPVQIDETKTAGTVAPTYPVIEYGHVPGGGDAISNGYVYRGKTFPALQGKYLFGDITTGRIWWADFQEMLALDAAKNPRNMAQMHEVSILWDRPDGGKELYPTMAPITLAGYHARGGKAADLPGRAPVSGGRSDIRLAMDSAGNLYILSKTDGMIRAVVGVTSN
jgi:Glucose / Sorbosone dehydrogenase